MSDGNARLVTCGPRRRYSSGMAIHTVALRGCPPSATLEEVSAGVAEILDSLPGIDAKLSRAKRILIKINLCPGKARTYADRPIDFVDPAVYAGLAAYLRDHTDADVSLGDGTDGEGPAAAAEQQGHAGVIEEYGHHLLDLNQPPFSLFSPSHPAMFRSYHLSSRLENTDVIISLAKMKSHHLCGITLSIKNLFGMPPNAVYGSPRVALHSALRLPPILVDLAQILPPDICLIDGIVGANYSEWGGDPVRSGILLAGDNCVAADATAARFMGVDPGAPHGAAPFLNADNHVRLCAESGLGSVAESEIDVIGDMPSGRKPYTVGGAAEPGTFEANLDCMRRVSGQALRFFDARDEYARKYPDEVLALHEDRVLYHAPVHDGLTGEAAAALREAGVGIYDPFFKLVEAEELELREPYAAL